MATPRVTIDQLPDQAVIEGTNYVIVQDTGVTKKLLMSTLLAAPSTALSDHLADTTDAHDATAISAVVSGTGVDGADVQSQLGQLTTLVNGKLNQTVADGLYVNLTGDTMTGPLVLVSDPTGALEAATKQYVDQKVIDAGGGITQPEADALYVNITGDTMTGPLTVDALMTTGTGLVLPAGEPTAANRAAPKSYVDGLVAPAALDLRYVKKPGDTMSGALKILSGTEQLALGRNDGSNNPHLGFYKSDLVTRMGFIQYLDGISMRLHTSQPSTTIEFFTDSTLRAWVGASRFHSTVPVWCESGVRSGPGTLMWNSTGAAMFQFYANATDVATLGASSGYVGENGGAFQLRKQSAGNLQFYADSGDIQFFPGGTEQGRWMNAGGHLLIGKTTNDNFVTDGVQLQVNGVVSSTTDTASTHNLWVNHISGMDANGMIFATFRRTTAGTQIGSITQTSTTGVAFNQTSDKRLKTFTRDVDDDEALAKMEAITPVHFTWNDAPDDGEQIGFFAQDLQPIVPEAVAEGIGEPGDEDFIPWGTDNSKLVPYLVSAVQALGRKLIAVRTELEELRASMGNL